MIDIYQHQDLLDEYLEKLENSNQLYWFTILKDLGLKLTLKIRDIPIDQTVKYYYNKLIVVLTPDQNKRAKAVVTYDTESKEFTTKRRALGATIDRVELRDSILKAFVKAISPHATSIACDPEEGGYVISRTVDIDETESRTYLIRKLNTYEQSLVDDIYRIAKYLPDEIALGSIQLQVNKVD